jgi:hypothetical protein
VRPESDRRVRDGRRAVDVVRPVEGARKRSRLVGRDVKGGRGSLVSAGGPESIEVSGGVVSIRKGPMCDVPLQLPDTFTARRWNHQEPSGRTDERVVVVSSTSVVVSGSVSELSDHSYE